MMSRSSSSPGPTEAPSPRRPRPTRRARWRVVALAVLLATLLLWPAPRRAIGTALFLPDLVPGVTLRPLAWTTRPPERRTLVFDRSSADAPQPADPEAALGDEAIRGERQWDGLLFLPADQGPHPGLVIALGVTPAGRDDPRVVSLGDGLARLGIATFVPYSANLEGKRVTPDEIDFLVAAHRTLAAQPTVDPQRVGFFGLCVGASLALLATGDERIADEVAVLGWFGGYHRLEHLLAAVTSETAVVDGRRVPWQPDPLAREVVRTQLLALLSEDERIAVVDALESSLPDGDSGAASTGEANRTRGAVAALSPAAGAVLELLSGPDRAEAEALLARLPADARATMETLSPASRAADVKAPVYLMSDTGDALIPAGETDALAADLGERVARRTVFTVFSHVDLAELEEPWTVARELSQLYGQVHAIRAALRARSPD